MPLPKLWIFDKILAAWAPLTQNIAGNSKNEESCSITTIFANTKYIHFMFEPYFELLTHKE